MCTSKFRFDLYVYFHRCKTQTASRAKVPKWISIPRNDAKTTRDVVSRSTKLSSPSLTYLLPAVISTLPSAAAYVRFSHPLRNRPRRSGTRRAVITRRSGRHSVRRQTCFVNGFYGRKIRLVVRVQK